MIICVCKAVNDRAIRRAVADGCETFDEVQFELGVGTCCGKCVTAACEVLFEARNAASAAANTHPVRIVPRIPQREFAIA